jgi:hypothetical protein
MRENFGMKGSECSLKQDKLQITFNFLAHADLSASAPSCENHQRHILFFK